MWWVERKARQAAKWTKCKSANANENNSRRAYHALARKRKWRQPLHNTWSHLCACAPLAWIFFSSPSCPFTTDALPATLPHRLLTCPFADFCHLWGSLDCNVLPLSPITSVVLCSLLQLTQFLHNPKPKSLKPSEWCNCFQHNFRVFSSSLMVVCNNC